MATRTWVGGAPTQVQVSTAAVTAYDATTTYSVIITGENGATTTISVVGSGGTTTTVAAALVVAFNASVSPLCTGITASNSSANFILTADTAGVPFTPTTSEVTGTGTIGDFSVTTPNSGPNDYNCIGNWAQAAIPVANDLVLITGTSNITYGLNQSSVEVDGFYVMPGYSGTIGTASAYLQIDVDNATRFEFSGTGTSYIDVGGAAISPIIKKTKTATGGQAGLYLKGSALVTIDQQSGVVRYDSTTFTTLYVGSASSCTAYVASTCTVTTVQNMGGTIVLECAATTVNNQSGTLTTEGSGAITTLNCDAGTVYSNSSGTVTTVNADGGTVDFSKNRVARTVTTMNFRGATVKYDANVMTFTTPAYTSAYSASPLE